MAKNKWKKQPTGLKKDKVPVMGKVLAEKRKQDNKLIAKALSMDEKMRILEKYNAGETDTNILGQMVNRSPEAIRKFLWRYADTSVLASARIRGGAEQLADRIVEQANVDQALEVMDRLDILSKKRDKAAPATAFNLVMGTFNVNSKGDKNAQGGVPVPSQKQIDDAIEAEVVKAAATVG